MELTRRDAVAALAAAGVGIGGGCAAPRSLEDATEANGADSEPVTLSETETATLVAVAEAVYPTAVSGVEPFVEAYIRGRIDDVRDDAYRRGVVDAVELLDARARSWHGAPFLELEPSARERLLRQVGSDTAEPDPEGTDAERVRHFLVNEVLFALYASPTGGELVGIENPQGHPGGLESYRRGPDA